MKFTNKQLEVMTEIHRRFNYFSKGKNSKQILCEFPSYAKCVVKLGLIEPFSKETPKVNNWYNLTDLGKLYFSNYIEVISEDRNVELACSLTVMEFDYNLYKSLKSK